MNTFFSQPLAFRLGNELIRLVESREWDSIRISVAWVRRSGMQHISPALSDYLTRGGKLQVISGIDVNNTSYEGLEELLKLEALGAAETFVHHNENAYLFHPKVYLLENKCAAKLIVASNNLTEAGLFRNTEAALVVDTSLKDQAIVGAKEAIDSWKDSATDLARRLDKGLLGDLLTNGYVLREHALRAAFSSPGTKTHRARTTPLFGRVTITAPTITTSPKGGKKSTKVVRKGSVSKSATAPGHVLLMRVRKASATARPTQTQIPKRVYVTKFFNGITSVKSSHDGAKHKIIAASARGTVNTLKLEIPEIKTFDDPVVRFERTTKGIVYEAYNAISAKGKQIMKSLEYGRGLSPPLTSLTIPGRPTSATWWRFI